MVVSCALKLVATLRPLALRCQRTSRKNIIYFFLHSLIARWLQITHRRFHIRMPEPLLYRPQVYPGPEASRSEGRSEFMQPEVFLVKLSAFGACFQAVEEIQFRIAARGRKHQEAVLVGLRLPRFQFFCEPRRDRNLPLFVRL